MMDNPKTGFGHAAEFQSSALPWVTSSVAPAAASGPVRHDFPKVARFITVSNRDGAANTLSFGFTYNGVKFSNNKFVLGAGQSLTLELRVKSIWVQGETGTPNYSVLAGLTTVDARDMPELTGSVGGWTGVG